MVHALKKGERCADCQQVVGESDSCLFQRVIIENAEQNDPLAPSALYPSAGRPMQLVRSTRHQTGASGRCEGCGIRHGGFHHYGCPVEICPACGGRILYCKCKKIELQIGPRSLERREK